jgi:Protein of unknown function (DUF3168)
VSAAEQALESGILAVLAADVGVMAVLGDPVRVLEAESPRPSFPYLEITRHQSVPAGSAGVEAREHRLDLAAVSRLDQGVDSRAAIGAVRAALEAGTLVLDGWRCTLLVPVFVDTFREAVGRWRTILRLKAMVEAA